jgi:cytidylate kinase
MDSMKRAKQIMARPMVEWEAAADRMNARERAEIADALNQITQRAARAASYFEERYGYGCSDRGHAEAVKAQNKLVAKIRKALGFSYPKQDVSF